MKGRPGEGAREAKAGPVLALAGALLIVTLAGLTGCDEMDPLGPEIRENATQSGAPTDSTSGGALPDSLESGGEPDSGDDPDGDLPPGPSGEGLLVEVDAREAILEIRPAVWPGDRRAACSIAFDDNWSSHTMFAAPELERRGMRGTFNLIAGQVARWEPWQALVDQGHEIANHTLTHPLLSALTPEEAEEEILIAHRLLRDRLPGARILSFSYPGGDCPSWAPAIVARDHLSARVGQGIESADPADFLRVRGKGYYGPFSLDDMNAAAAEAIASGSWYIPYFHSISPGSVGGRLDCPLWIFSAHLDYLAARAEDIWVAPQSTVTRYIRERQECRCTIADAGRPQLRIEVDLDAEIFDVPLTILCRLQPWADETLLTVDGRTVSIAAGGEWAKFDVIPGGSHDLKVERRVRENVSPA